MRVMQLLGRDSLILTPSDLAGFAECGHLVTLEIETARGLRKRTVRDDPQLDLIREKGGEFEARQLAAFEAEGKRVVSFERPGSSAEALSAAQEATLAAMKGGADVIYQGTFFDGRWRGHPDFLLRVEAPSTALGAWSYEVADSKLARHAKPSALLQLCFYTEALGLLQGLAPPTMHLILGDGKRQSHRVADYVAYYRALKRRFEERTDPTPVAEATYPEPVDHCRICNWYPDCAERRRKDDHLSRVAGIRSTQVECLKAGGLPTLTSLGKCEANVRPIDIGPKPFDRLHNQARLQLDQYADSIVRYELIPPDTEGLQKGLALLPEP
ncbi:MAG TPA: TM0106 family RecB-like putative nuclease, partial [Thermoanaerobaculia bacterium]|nr:TM0106 family RecB-like putative nuclease [Thermoanaerobaculia bacterium]